MLDDFPTGSNYGKLSAKFYAGRLRFIEIVDLRRFFLNYLLRQSSQYFLTATKIENTDKFSPCEPFKKL